MSSPILHFLFCLGGLPDLHVFGRGLTGSGRELERRLTNVVAHNAGALDRSHRQALLHHALMAKPIVFPDRRLIQVCSSCGVVAFSL